MKRSYPQKKTPQKLNFLRKKELPDFRLILNTDSLLKECLEI